MHLSPIELGFWANLDGKLRDRLNFGWSLVRMNLGFRVSNHNSQIRVYNLGGFWRVEGGGELSVVIEESVEGRDKGCVNAMV